ncbi:flavin-containing monooxygenase FMO GS-OX-like 3 [Hibiscus syriacus]|uniref:flavin-containing monooxygenase FMO GS-OX-like 3 n=1 Tax=Hibiscus syriacus TaxID=106335 RepID=UPI0019209A9F|nr:flavin-containing monooxygenase FMO GS-OX-like 3 [Hibiscus syriacus]
MNPIKSKSKKYGQRELQREGHRVVVFGKADKVGDMWLYNTQVMGFLDYPFMKKEGDDLIHFPGHEEVHKFIEDFSWDFGLMELIRFKHEVVSHCVSHLYMLSISSCLRKKEHSHRYTKESIVVLIGNGPSATDILREITPLAKQVHQAIRGPNFRLIKLEKHDEAWQHSMIECAHEDGKVVFQDGSIIDVDVIINCPGYKYYFPFLKSNGIVTVNDDHVGPLYKHVFSPSLTLGFLL